MLGLTTAFLFLVTLSMYSVFIRHDDHIHTGYNAFIKPNHFYISICKGFYILMTVLIGH